MKLTKIGRGVDVLSEAIKVSEAEMKEASTRDPSMLTELVLDEARGVFISELNQQSPNAGTTQMCWEMRKRMSRRQTRDIEVSRCKISRSAGRCGCRNLAGAQRGKDSRHRRRLVKGAE